MTRIEQLGKTTLKKEGGVFKYDPSSIEDKRTKTVLVERFVPAQFEEHVNELIDVFLRGVGFSDGRTTD